MKRLHLSYFIDTKWKSLSAEVSDLQVKGEGLNSHSTAASRLVTLLPVTLIGGYTRFVSKQAMHYRE